MAYVVPNMKLIPQSKTMSCWYASLQMLVKWKEEQRQASLAHLISPEFDAECIKLRDANNGIVNPDIIRLANRLGLKTVPPLSPTPETIEGWLKDFGPLWVNGKSHIVVIAGIMYLPHVGHWLLVFDPQPVNVGKIEWRSLADWYANGTAPDSRDTSSSVQAVFMYIPDNI